MEQVVVTIQDSVPLAALDRTLSARLAQEGILMTLPPSQPHCGRAGTRDCHREHDKHARDAWTIRVLDSIDDFVHRYPD